MSRRGAGSNKTSPPTAVLGQVKPASLSLEKEEIAPLSSSGDPSTSSDITASGTAATESGNSSTLRHWKESAFAAALTESTWEAERDRTNGVWSSDGGSGSSRRSRRLQANNDDVAEELDDLVHPDTTGCLCCSAMVCPLFGAQRVGNMAVLHSSHEWVEEVDEDPETGECKVHRYTRPKLSIVVGPYWPMLFFVTYPLIFVVSGWAFYIGIWPGKKPAVVVVAWMVITLGLIMALGCTGCRDPGILYRHKAPPPQFENNWRWSDQAQSYRPRSAHFDTDTAVIVEEFDHTCPWTGTAIGKKNMLPFQFFVCLVFVCLIVDIFLITGAV